MKTKHFSLLETWLVIAFLVACSAMVRGDVTDPLPDSSFWTELLSFLKNVKVLPLAGVVMALVQLTLVFFRTSFGNLAGIYKLAVVTGLAVVYAFVARLASGASVLEALLDGAVISAVMVFVNEIKKHFTQQFVNPIGSV